MKNKKLMLLAVGAMGFVALGTAGVGTAAWYASSTNAAVNQQSAVAGSIASASTTLDVANTYYIKITVEDVASVQLSHLGGGASDYINGSTGATYVDGTLYKGVYVTDSSLVRVEALADNGLADFVKAYTVTAAWVNSEGTAVSAPSDDFDVAYLGGKSFTVNLTAGGKVKFCKKNNKASGLKAEGEEANATSTSVTVSITAGTLALSVGTPTLPYARLEPKYLQAAEDGSDHGTGVDTITPAAVLTDGHISLS